MGVADKAKAAQTTGDPPSSSMATLTRTLEELERRLARLSAQKPPEAAPAPAAEPATPAERLRRIVDKSAQYAARGSAGAEDAVRGAGVPGAATRGLPLGPTLQRHEAVDELVQEMRALRGEMRKEIAAGSKAGQAAMGHAFATLEASLSARDSSDLIADGLADLLTRMATLEEKGATQLALAQLHADTHRMRDVVAGLATQDALNRHMGAVTQRLDTLLETSAATLDRPAFDAGVAALGERLSGIEAMLARLPETLGVDRLDERLRALAAAPRAGETDVLSVTVDLSSLEERLDEISGAILVLDRPDMEQLRLEERLAEIAGHLDSLSARQAATTADLSGQIARHAFPEAALQARLDAFLQRLEQIEEDRSRRHAEVFTHELKRLETLWQGADERTAETEKQLLSILHNVAERLSELEAETRGGPAERFGGTVFDADFAAWQPEDGGEDSLRATLDRHLKRRRGDAPEAQAEAPGSSEAATVAGGATAPRYGRDVADFGSILDRVRRHERAAGLGPSTRADFIAAARRAAAAAAAEAESVHAGTASGQGGGSRHGRYRKPMFMAAGAIMLALTALPISRLQQGPADKPVEIADGGMPAVSPEMTASVPQMDAQAGATGDVIARLLADLPSDAVGELPPVPVGDATLARAAVRGDAAAMGAIGAAAIDRGEFSQGLSWLGQSARRGYAPAQYRLGSLYERGAGVARNLAHARDWYLVAARAGNVRAMHNLAVIAISGLAGPADRTQAANWFRLAAERGMSDSQFNLAVLYARGAGLERDAAEAYRWFSVAARSGDRTAQRNRDEIGTELGAAARARIEAEVAQWRPVPPTRAANEERFPAPRV